MNNCPLINKIEKTLVMPADTYTLSVQADHTIRHIERNGDSHSLFVTPFFLKYQKPCIISQL